MTGSTHLIPALLLIYRPRKDERLSWPSWLTCSGWFIHISGHPSAAGHEQDRESSPVRDRRSTTVLRHQLGYRVIESNCFHLRWIAHHYHWCGQYADIVTAEAETYCDGRRWTGLHLED